MDNSVLPEVTDVMVDGDIEPDRNKNLVQAVERALELLDILADYPGSGLAVSDISIKAGLKLTTTHRLLNTMVLCGYVEKSSETGHYRLGIRALRLGNAAMTGFDLDVICHPYLEELARITGETTNLALLDGAEVIYIDQVESSNMVLVKMFAKKGNRGPAYCTGSGKVLLAGLGDKELHSIMRNIKFHKFTSETIDDSEKLLKELDEVRRQGYALDLGERDEGVRCVAAPIRNHEGRVEAAISVSGPSMRMTNYHLKHELIGRVCDMAMQISSRLGFRAPSTAKRT